MTDPNVARYLELIMVIVTVLGTAVAALTGAVWYSINRRMGKMESAIEAIWSTTVTRDACASKHDAIMYQLKAIVSPLEAEIRRFTSTGGNSLTGIDDRLRGVETRQAQIAEQLRAMETKGKHDAAEPEDS